ncbi:unnamed protein product [Protopolystoma xenopodis]|uniref:Uncharacterized protein n=1 Tax=Protopolystoma xenopodis TaxID=117903 RepID=A0A448XEB1_9PLAT|nr:unnamed protein product [Protopolystoma xenopodis]
MCQVLWHLELPSQAVGLYAVWSPPSPVSLDTSRKLPQDQECPMSNTNQCLPSPVADNLDMKSLKTSATTISVPGIPAVTRSASISKPDALATKILSAQRTTPGTASKENQSGSHQQRHIDRIKSSESSEERRSHSRLRKRTRALSLYRMACA